MRHQGPPKASKLAKVLDPLLSCNRLARTLSSPCVGPCTLAPYRQANLVPHPTVALDFSQSMDRLTHLPSKWTFDRVVAFEQARQTAQLIFVQLTSLFGRIDLGLNTRFSCYRWTNAIKILKRVDDLFVVRNVNTKKTRHTCLLLNHCLERFSTKTIPVPVPVHSKNASVAKNRPVRSTPMDRSSPEVYRRPRGSCKC